jgi:hypothetical protein
VAPWHPHRPEFSLVSTNLTCVVRRPGLKFPVWVNGAEVLLEVERVESNLADGDAADVPKKCYVLPLNAEVVVAPRERAAKPDAEAGESIETLPPGVSINCVGRLLPSTNGCLVRSMTSSV